jgi:ABC-2 type transport system permease protein
VKSLTIAYVALLRLLRDRSNIFFVFILPIGIILIIGAQFGGGFIPKIGVVVEDGAGELARDLATSVQARGDVDVITYGDSGAAVTAVERGSLQAAVVIPSGYDATLRSGGSAEVGFYARPDAGVYETIVRAEVSDQASLVRAARFAEAEEGVPFDEAFAIASAADDGIAGVTVTEETTGKALFPASIGQFGLGASTQLVLFMFLTGLTGSAALIETRRLGVASRMLSTPTTAGTVVTGEGLGRYAVVMLQGLYILFATLLLFQVNWGDPLGAAAVMIVFGAVCAGAAMLMGTVFKNDQQAGGVGVILGIGLAALGGCMIPIEIFSETMQNVAHITPHAWALDAFAVLIREDGTVADILPELAVLAGFAVVLITISGLRLRRAMSTR